MSTDCPHDHLRFEDGVLHLVCIDCNQTWTGTTGKNGPTDHSLSNKVLLPFRNTRHDKWVSARTISKKSAF